MQLLLRRNRWQISQIVIFAPVWDDSAVFLHKPDDVLCISIRLRNLIQCIFDEIVLL